MIERDDVDAVCVATPDAAHHAAVRAALEAGKHVLCEKPFTTDLAEADDLLTLARSRPRQKLQVAFNHRWLSSYYQGAVAIRKGDIGRPVAGLRAEERHDLRADGNAPVGGADDADPFSGGA